VFSLWHGIGLLAWKHRKAVFEKGADVFTHKNGKREKIVDICNHY